MKVLLAIGTGSFIGGILRYLISQFIQSRFLSSFPFGTMFVNICGCFMIGIVFVLSDKGSIPQEWRLFIGTGILGGFTTFSAFSNEAVSMLQDGQYLFATAYVGTSVLLGLIATITGILFIKLLS